VIRTVALGTFIPRRTPLPLSWAWDVHHPHETARFFDASERAAVAVIATLSRAIRASLGAPRAERMRSSPLRPTDVIWHADAARYGDNRRAAPRPWRRTARAVVLRSSRARGGGVAHADARGSRITRQLFHTPHSRADAEPFLRARGPARGGRPSTTRLRALPVDAAHHLAIPASRCFLVRIPHISRPSSSRSDGVPQTFRQIYGRLRAASALRTRSVSLFFTHYRLRSCDRSIDV